MSTFAGIRVFVGCGNDGCEEGKHIGINHNADFHAYRGLLRSGTACSIN